MRGHSGFSQGGRRSPGAGPGSGGGAGGWSGAGGGGDGWDDDGGADVDDDDDDDDDDGSDGGWYENDPSTVLDGPDRRGFWHHSSDDGSHHHRRRPRRGRDDDPDRVGANTLGGTGKGAAIALACFCIVVIIIGTVATIGATAVLQKEGKLNASAGAPAGGSASGTGSANGSGSCAKQPIKIGTQHGLDPLQTMPQNQGWFYDAFNGTWYESLPIWAEIARDLSSGGGGGLSIGQLPEGDVVTDTDEGETWTIYGGGGDTADAATGKVYVLTEHGVEEIASSLAATDNTGVPGSGSESLTLEPDPDEEVEPSGSAEAGEGVTVGEGEVPVPVGGGSSEDLPAIGEMAFVTSCVSSGSSTSSGKGGSGKSGGGKGGSGGGDGGDGGGSGKNQSGLPVPSGSPNSGSAPASAGPGSSGGAGTGAPAGTAPAGTCGFSGKLQSRETGSFLHVPTLDIDGRLTNAGCPHAWTKLYVTENSPGTSAATAVANAGTPNAVFTFTKSTVPANAGANATPTANKTLTIGNYEYADYDNAGYGSWWYAWVCSVVPVKVPGERSLQTAPYCSSPVRVTNTTATRTLSAPQPPAATPASSKPVKLNVNKGTPKYPLTTFCLNMNNYRRDLGCKQFGGWVPKQYCDGDLSQSTGQQIAIMEDDNPGACGSGILGCVHSNDEFCHAHPPPAGSAWAAPPIKTKAAVKPRSGTGKQSSGPTLAAKVTPDGTAGCATAPAPTATAGPAGGSKATGGSTGNGTGGGFQLDAESATPIGSRGSGTKVQLDAVVRPDAKKTSTPAAKKASTPAAKGSTQCSQSSGTSAAGAAAATAGGGSAAGGTTQDILDQVARDLPQITAKEMSQVSTKDLANAANLLINGESCGGSGPSLDVAGPANAAGVPSNLIPIFVAAANRFGLNQPGQIPGWAYLAGINEVESDFGRSTLPGVASGANGFGAAGPMQIGIEGASGTAWSKYQVAVAGGPNPPSVYDETDAVYAAANYLHSALQSDGGNWASAIFTYNHADWYVQEVTDLARRYASGSGTTQVSLAADIVSTSTTATTTSTCATTAADITGPTIPGTKPVLESDGLVAIPTGAPAQVQEALAAGNRIIDTYYSQERHANMLTQVQNSYDCSASTDFILYNAGLGNTPAVDAGNGVARDSSALMNYGSAGVDPKGWITVYANSIHAFIDVDGIVMDTAHYSQVQPKTSPDYKPPYDQPDDGGPNSGPRWQPESIIPEQQSGDSGGGFTPRHPTNL